MQRHQNLEPIVVRVSGAMEELTRFRNAAKPFSHNVPGNPACLAVFRKPNAADKMTSSSSSRKQTQFLGNELHFIFDDRQQHDVVMILYDSSSVESIDAAADTAEQVEPLVSFVVVDLNASQSPEAAVGRNELVSHVMSAAEYCGQFVAPPDSDGAFGDTINANNTNNTSISSSSTSPDNTNKLAAEKAIDMICVLCVDAIRFPKQVLWDGQSLTSTARKSIRRSFWLLDRDGDNALCDSELVHFLHAVYGGYSSEDIAEVKSFVQNIIDRQVADGADPVSAKLALMSNDGHITLLGFFGICHVMVSESRHKLVWQLFASHGVESDGKPYRDTEIERAATTVFSEDPQSSLHLSEVGVNFFASLYLTRPRQNPRDLFLFTPDCPWRTVYGLPNAEETSIPVAEFVQCWRFMTQIDPPTVAIFAKYWAFQGDPASLFVAYKNRRFRQQNAVDTNAVPPTAMFLVLGSGNCGKTTMMQHIAHPAHLYNDNPPLGGGNGGAGGNGGGGDSPQPQKPSAGGPSNNSTQYHHPYQQHTPGRSVAILPVHLPCGVNGRRREVCVTLRELEDSEVDEMLSDKAFMETIDGILLCYDGSDPYSFGFVASVLPKVCAPAQLRLPVLLVLCKADLPLEDQMGLVHGPEQLCQLHGLPWPPTIVSAFGERKLLAASGLTNEIENIPMILAELIVRPEVLTEVSQRQQSGGSSIGFARVVKRAVVLSVLGVSVYSAASYLERRFHWLKYFPALTSAAKSLKETIHRVVPPEVRDKCVDAWAKVQQYDVHAAALRASTQVKAFIHSKLENTSSHRHTNSSSAQRTS